MTDDCVLLIVHCVGVNTVHLIQFISWSQQQTVNSQRGAPPCNRGWTFLFFKAFRPAVAVIQRLFIRGIKTTANLHLEPRLRMSIAIPPLSHMPSRHVPGQLFTFTLFVVFYVTSQAAMTTCLYYTILAGFLLFTSTGNWNPSSYSIEELFKATVVILELAVLEQRAQILGGICIFDLGGISLQHAWQITPAIARRTVELMVVSYTRMTLHSPYVYKVRVLQNPNWLDVSRFIITTSLWIFSVI